MDPFYTFINNLVTYIINPVIGLLVALAVAYFIYGAAMFILSADSEEGRKKGKAHLLWGVIGLFVIVAVYGILNIVVSTFGVRLPQ